MHDERAGHTLPQVFFRCSHRFYFAMRNIQLLESATTQKLLVVPYGPESNGRVLQTLYIEGMNAPGRCVFYHFT